NIVGGQKAAIIAQVGQIYSDAVGQYYIGADIEAIKRAEAGLAVPELCRELGISSATFYKWRSKFGGMDVSMMSRMKELEAENARLRKMYVEER
ncbi:transposase, partial [Bordetella holmesii CDC-H785-BH]